MKRLYLECHMGAAGDMLMGALYELLPDQVGFLETMNALPGIRVRADRAVTCGVVGTHISVRVDGEEEEAHDIPLGQSDHNHAHEHDHAHEHNHDHEHDHAHEHNHDHASRAGIRGIIDAFPLPESVRADAQAVYDRIADAESRVHGVPVTEIHFHEVGSMDAVADIVGVCFALHLLAPDAILASPIHLGSGQVRCAHGVLPVPAPATAILLEGLPCYSGEICGELCTPTGAALLAHFVQKFGAMPPTILRKTGYGVGKKEFPAANCVRALWGDAEQREEHAIVELCCHIDDMTAEALAFAAEQLMNAGALDVAAAPITMKKGRLGVAFTVLCQPEEEDRMAEAILRETTTNGVRSRFCRKYILQPSVKTVDTAHGRIAIKCADGYGIHRQKPECESVAAAARAEGLPFQQVWEDVMTQIKLENGKNHHRYNI